jgi:GNAT superfamily N-acetyltransferase
MSTPPLPNASTGLRLRPLDPDSAADVAAVAGLIEADPGYTQRADGRDPEPGDAEGLLRDAPPGVGPDDKVALGALDGDRLVAVVDLIRGWPTSGTALVGLLQVHARHQGRGWGRIVHDLLLEWVTRNWPETRAMRAVIVAPNAPHADPFWRAMGYQPQGGPVPYAGARVRTTAQGWVRLLAP